MSAVATFLKEFKPSADGKIASIEAASNNALYDEAYEFGLADGMLRAEAETEAQVARSIEALVERLSDTATLRQEIAGEVTAQAAESLARVIRKICPDLAALGLADRARGMLETELANVAHPITLRAAQDVAEKLSPLIADDSVTIETSESLSDLRIEIDWSEGRAVLDTDVLAEKICALAAKLSPCVETGEHESHDPTN